MSKFKDLTHLLFTRHPPFLKDKEKQELQHRVLQWTRIHENTRDHKKYFPLMCRSSNNSQETNDVPRWYRYFEIVVAAFALFFTSPIMLVLAAIIRLDTPGPALFFQQRVGLNQRPYRFVKFRTFYVDARERFPELYTYQYFQEDLINLQFKTPDDPRVTPQGKWIRQSSLDELPNFWNVLTGDMALVGPRPEIPEMLPYYKGDMLKKFTVRPGITGLSQISGRGRLRFYESVALDVHYVENRSLRLDLQILFRTLILVFKKDGAF